MEADWRLYDQSTAHRAEAADAEATEGRQRLQRRGGLALPCVTTVNLRDGHVATTAANGPSPMGLGIVGIWESFEKHAVIGFLPFYGIFVHNYLLRA